VPFVLLVPGAHPRSPAPRPWLPIAVACGWTLLWAASGGPGIRVDGLATRLPAIGAAVLEHVRILVWPHDLHLERFVAVPGRSVATVLATWGAVGALVAGLAWIARVVPGGFVLLAVAVATYLPASGVVPVYPEIADRALFTAEHFLYLPLVGLVPLLAGAAARVVPARAGTALTAALLVAWTPIVLARNRDFRDEETLFRHTLRWKPPVARVWYDLGNVRLAAGDPVEAERLYREAAARAPRDGAVRLNLGIALQRQGRRDEAVAAYDEAVRLDPSLARAFRREP
jgi:hypothetical protein